MSNTMRYAVAAAFVAAVFISGFAVLPRDNLGTEPSPTPGPTATETPDLTEAPGSTLPNRGLPGTRADAAGEYGWTGALGSITGMHSAVTDGSKGRQTQLVFAVEDDCFARGAGEAPVPVTVAGLDGLYVEPYEDPAVVFVSVPEAGQTTGAYALPIGDRTLCVYITWDAATTQAELDAAHQVLESIRGQPFGETGIRINFTLPAGWDTG